MRKKVLFFLKQQKATFVPSLQAKLQLEGAKGGLSEKLDERLAFFKKSNSSIFFASKSYFKTFLSLVRNMLYGASFGYMVRLQLQGVGYRALIYKDTNQLFIKTEGKIFLSYFIDKKIFAKAKKQKILLYSLDKQTLFSTVQKIKNLQITNPYTGKGIKVFGSIITLKAGKQRNR